MNLLVVKTSLAENTKTDESFWDTLYLLTPAGDDLETEQDTDLFDLDLPFAWIEVSLLLAAIGRCLIFSSLLEGVITSSTPPDAILLLSCNPGSTML